MLYFFSSMLLSIRYAARTSLNSFKSSRIWFEFCISEVNKDRI